MCPPHLYRIDVSRSVLKTIFTWCVCVKRNYLALAITEVLGLRITRILTHLREREAEGARMNVNTAVSVSGRAGEETGTQPQFEGQAEG